MHVQQTVDGEFGADGENDIGGRREPIAVQTEDLPDQSLDPVAPHSVACLAVHTDPQSVVRQGVGQEDQGEPLSPKPPAGSVDALKLPGCSQQMLFRKRAAIQAVQGANCLRPFALRLLITARPVRVFMRTRNPWVRARLVVLGWNVLLLIIQFLSC